MKKLKVGHLVSIAIIIFVAYYVWKKYGATILSQFSSLGQLGSGKTASTATTATSSRLGGPLGSFNTAAVVNPINLGIDPTTQQRIDLFNRTIDPLAYGSLVTLGGPQIGGQGTAFTSSRFLNKNNTGVRFYDPSSAYSGVAPIYVPPDRTPVITP